MYKVTKVSDKALKQDIKRYKKLVKERYSLSVHIKRSAIERRADEIMVSFLNGHLKLEPEQYALFAEYVDVCGNNKEECFDLLQQKADFDVRKHVQTDNRTWWKKIFSKKSSQEAEYLSATKMQKMADKYIQLNREVERSQYSKPWLATKIEKMRADAENYVKAYLDGKVDIKPEDAFTFKNYIKVMLYPLYEGGDGKQALQKLEDEQGDALAASPAVKEEKTATTVPLWSRLKQTAQAKIVDIKENNTLYRRAAVGIAGVVAMGALWLGFKDDIAKSENSTLKDKKIDKTEAQAQQTEKNKTDDKMIHFSFVAADYKSTPVDNHKINDRASINSQAVAKQTQSGAQDSLSLARKNHHDYVLKMRLGAAQGKKLVEQIDYLMRKNLISLPKDMLAEDFAYAMEMYRAYGVESSLNEALNSTLESKQKLSSEANKKVIEDILAVGPTGLGVKKMAAELNGGKLNHKSVYDRASQKSQKQYKMNMKQWHKLKKQASKAA